MSEANTSIANDAIDVYQMLRDLNAVDEQDDVLYPLVVHKILEI